MSFQHSPMQPMRRALLGAGLALPFGAVRGALPATDSKRERILVVLEMSGGNDGPNTVVPHADDLYDRLRPNLGIRPERVRRIDDRHGFNPGMTGFERLYKDGRLAIVHGYGYAQPGGEPGFVIDIASSQSLAVRCRSHVPLVFDDPERFVWQAPFEERALLERDMPQKGEQNPTRRYLHDIAQGARVSSARVREACAGYRTPVDYGLMSMDLPKVAAPISAGVATRLFYVSYRNNAFDTHVQQADTHQRLLTYVSNAVAGFLRDTDRIGRADDVVPMAFSEFGRRVPENANLGTDHGTAGPMFIAGKPVRGGQYGEPPNLAPRTADDNLVHTTDFRRVYATLAPCWLGLQNTIPVVRDPFEPLAMFS